jgi:hypothetical protein
MQSLVETEVISVEQNTERRSISIFASLCATRRDSLDQIPRGGTSLQAAHTL